MGPLKANNTALLNDFNNFFHLSTVTVFDLPSSVFDRAAHVRATYGFRALDALHLASAAEHGCGLFLTNDARLVRFPDVPVEVLS